MARLRVAAAALGGTLLLAGLLTLAALSGASGRSHSTGGFAVAHPTSAQPLAFEPNAGRFDSALDYLVRGRGSTLTIRPTGSVLGVVRSQLTTTLAGASQSADPTPGSKLKTRVNWYAGGDRSKWRTGLPTCAAVTYGGVYPGIDLRYRGENGRIEYDFLLAPHADPNRIALDLRGASALRIDRHGDLLAHVGRHTVRQLR